jgi:drug/metabolite transporter (DMT)-like permease
MRRSVSLLETHAGELAALGTAAAWTCSSLAFERAGRRIGALSLNLIRLVLAFGLLCGLSLLLCGRAMPTDLGRAPWLWLSLSGLVGFVIGDLCLFRALVLLGAPRTMLIQTTAPAMTALLAWAALGEAIGLRDLLGMGLTTAAIGWVVKAHRAAAPQRDADSGPGLWPGLPLAIGGALGQAGGLVISKLGMGGAHAIAATQVRIAAGIAGFAVVLTVAGWWQKLGTALTDRRALTFAGIGALLGPCVGVSLSLYAVAHATAGVAASLMALTPILLLPMAYLRGERIGVAGIGGALLAVAGVVVLVS